MSADRDWDAELAKIDKQLASLSDDDLAARAPSRGAVAGSAPVAGAGAGGGVSAGGKGGAVAQAPAPRAGASGATPSPLGVTIRVGLGVVLAVGVLLWPYAAACGLPLVGYLGATAAVIAAGAWGAVATWRARAARAHVVALGVVAWGAVLLSAEVLPRIGYATDPARAAWLCQ